MSQKKTEDKYSGCGCLGCMGVLFLIMLLIGGCTAFFDDTDKDTENNKTEQKSNKQESQDKKDETEHKKTSENKSDNKKSEDKSDKNDEQDKDKSKDKKESSLKPGTTDRIPVELVSTVDGDTAKFNYDGKTESFRFLLIDTPETKHPRIGKEPYGQEASDRTEALLNGATNIEVEFDVGQKKDKYGRYLAYIYVDGEMLNNILVREGLAKVGYVYPPNTRYLSELEDSQDKAKSEQIGIWSIGSAFEDDENSQGNSSSSTETSTPEEPSTDSNTETPTTESSPSSNVVSFPNCTALREVYPDGVPQGHPAYSSKHDRDGDAYACEVN
ncbi:DNA-binding protein [Staphylococcus sp. HMSC057C08]|uniref:thermonuclease family protein n=1 Tax=Staphylococcus sp. HMSC057C08 TaxID=1739501 RepID=UPI0008A24E42|nr:thermonuclease family protein [Staphylococcus sp. HMSC057C08]OFP18555.1 DNA-binding protein [Staphylococcus sp. HMSC057C08]